MGAPATSTLRSRCARAWRGCMSESCSRALATLKKTNALAGWLCGLVTLLCMVAIQPRVEMGVNDDWSYIFTAKRPGRNRPHLLQWLGLTLLRLAALSGSVVHPHFGIFVYARAAVRHAAVRAGRAADACAAGAQRHSRLERHVCDAGANVVAAVPAAGDVLHVGRGCHVLHGAVLLRGRAMRAGRDGPHSAAVDGRSLRRRVCLVALCGRRCSCAFCCQCPAWHGSSGGAAACCRWPRCCGRCPPRLCLA